MYAAARAGLRPSPSRFRQSVPADGPLAVMSRDAVEAGEAQAAWRDALAPRTTSSRNAVATCSE